MPPAFVLSQNQTLKLMSDNHSGGKPEEEAGISGSRSCTSHILWICNETCRTYRRSKLRTIGPWNGLAFLPIDDTQRLSLTGAAAHMSLHLNRQCQRADALPSPLYPGQPGYRLRRRRRVGQNRPAGEGPYMEAICLRQWLFSETPRSFAAPFEPGFEHLPTGGRSRGRMRSWRVSGKTLPDRAAPSRTYLGGTHPAFKACRSNYQRPSTT
jgi:hypothetical protein